MNTGDTADSPPVPVGNPREGNLPAGVLPDGDSPASPDHHLAVPVRAVRTVPGRRLVGLAAVLAVLGTLTYLFQLFAPAPELALSAILACFPLLLVLVAVHRIEAFLTRPVREQLTAFTAGATVAFTAALVVSSYTSWYLLETVNAGVVEEFVKLGVTLVVASRFVTVTTPVQGAAVAMLVAAGVAFTENIAYFVIAASRGELYTVFLQRGVFSPLAHASFALCFGLALSIRGRVRRTLGLAVGLCAAMLLHVMWNALALGGSVALFAFPPLQIAQVVALVEIERRRARALVPLLDAAVAGAAPFSSPALGAHEVGLVLDLRARARQRAAIAAHARKEFDGWCRNWASLGAEPAPERLGEVMAQNALYRRVWATPLEHDEQ